MNQKDEEQQRNHIVFLALTYTFGFLGINNSYIGKKGITALKLLTFFSPIAIFLIQGQVSIYLLIPIFILFIWNFIELFSVKYDWVEEEDKKITCIVTIAYLLTVIIPITSTVYLSVFNKEKFVETTKQEIIAQCIASTQGYKDADKLCYCSAERFSEKLLSLPQKNIFSLYITGQTNLFTIEAISECQKIFKIGA